MKIGSALSQTCTLDEHIFSAPRHFRRTSSAVQACTEGTKARTGWVSVGKGIRQRPDHNCVPSGWHTRKWPPTILACGHIYIYICVYMYTYICIFVFCFLTASHTLSHVESSKCTVMYQVDKQQQQQQQQRQQQLTHHINVWLLYPHNGRKQKESKSKQLRPSCNWDS